VSGTVGDAGVDSADVSGEDKSPAGVGIGGGDNSNDDVVMMAFGGGDSSGSDETGGTSEDLELVEGSVDDDEDVDEDELSECLVDEEASLPERSIIDLALAPCIHKGFFIHLRGVSASGGEVALLVAVDLPRKVRECEDDWFEGDERVPRDANERGREYNASSCCKSDAFSV